MNKLSLLNGAPLPNWVKLIVLGALVGIIWGGQQNAVSRLRETQEETTQAVNELRLEIREKLVTEKEFLLLGQRVESNSRRIEAMERRERNR